MSRRVQNCRLIFSFEKDDVRPITDISLATLEGNQFSELTIGGLRTGTKVEGRSLEAQFAVEPGYLVFVSDDCPYEEVLRIYCVDKNMVVRDHVEIGSPYTTGMLTVVEMKGERTVEFSFRREDRWRVTVSFDGRLCLEEIMRDGRSV